jgi:GNAT superfamily N-acetyltransferase
MPLPIVMRPALENDAQALSTLICENALTTLAPYYSSLQLSTFLRYYSEDALRANIQHQTVFCAILEHEIIGTAALDGNFIVGFYTRKDFLNQGVGLIMLQFLEAYALQNGLFEIQLTATPSGVSFYLKNGWEKIQDGQFTYLGVEFPETLMRKRLREP